jgi:hypothetical protein
LCELKVSGDGNCQVNGGYIWNNLLHLILFSLSPSTRFFISYCELWVSFQFRALSDQLYRSPEYHKQVRREVVKQVKCLMSSDRWTKAAIYYMIVFYVHY